MKTKIFCDSADFKTIKKYNNNPLVDGFTTNPSLIRSSGAKNYKKYSLKILRVCRKKPISFEVFGDTFDVDNLCVTPLKDLIKNDKCVLKKLDLYKDHKILPVGSPRFDYEYGRQNSRKILKTNSKRTVLFFMGSMVKKIIFISVMIDKNVRLKIGNYITIFYVYSKNIKINIILFLKIIPMETRFFGKKF